jgi:NAD:arginine ADP-ribosyltransferase
MLDNIEIISEKEGLLEFWLRMGFEELSPQDVSGSPIQGVLDLPVPKSLTVAASGIADRHSITSSQSRAKELSQTKAGGPIKDMSPELYAAILLYTGNSIYRELNRCLRVEWKGAVKYWNYLRLYFEATDCMAKKEVTLWRGIAADLYDEYEPGKIITWWTVSSCTAAKSVAQNFMNQLGGAAATLLTLHTKRACDISSLSFYPHEQESLLSPGTKLRVKNRARNGKVAEIEVEEVLDEELDDNGDAKEEAAAAADDDADEKKPAAK